MTETVVGMNRVVTRHSLWWYLRRWPIIPMIILSILVFVGATAPWLAPNDPIKQRLPQRSARPFYQDGSPYLLGGDHVGRDVTSRVIHGARISLTVMIVAMTAGMLIGTTLGLVAGYAGGIVDEIITRIVDIWLGFPFLLLALVVAITIGASFRIVMGLMVLLAWSGFVRNVRADVLVLKEADYIASAKVAAASFSLPDTTGGHRVGWSRPWLGHQPLDVYGVKRQPTRVPSIPFYFRFLLVSARGFPGANAGVLGIDASARFARGSVARMRSTTPR